jgi:hypothetical protein
MPCIIMFLNRNGGLQSLSQPSTQICSDPNQLVLIKYLKKIFALIEVTIVVMDETPFAMLCV